MAVIYVNTFIREARSCAFTVS